MSQDMMAGTVVRITAIFESILRQPLPVGAAFGQGFTERWVKTRRLARHDQ